MPGLLEVISILEKYPITRESLEVGALVHVLPNKCIISMGHRRHTGDHDRKIVQHNPLWVTSNLVNRYLITKADNSSVPFLDTVLPRYNAVTGRHLLRPRYKRGAL